MTENPSPPVTLAPQYSIGTSVVLHLLPGALITLFYTLTARPVMRLGYPAIVALYLAILFVLLPFELGYLFYEGKKKNGRFSLKGVVLYQEPMPAWQYLVFVPVLLIWSFLSFGVLAPLDQFLIGNVFSWLPDWFDIANSMQNLAQYSRQAVLVTFSLSLALNGVIAPLVEELYFRGYLLPRIACLGAWAPFWNVLLFSFYHFFTPWQNLTRILALLLLVYIVWARRNLRISIYTHIALNTTGVLLTGAMIFQ